MIMVNTGVLLYFYDYIFTPICNFITKFICLLLLISPLMWGQMLLWRALLFSHYWGPWWSSPCKQNVETCFVHIQAKIRTKIVHFWWSCFVQKIRTKLFTFGGYALSTSKQMQTKLSEKSRDNVEQMVFRPPLCGH